MEWDTAAGEAVLAGAGGAVYDVQGQLHRYGKSGWRNGPFIACAGFTSFLIIKKSCLLFQTDTG